MSELTCVPYGYAPAEPISADVEVSDDKWYGVEVQLRWPVLQHLFPDLDPNDDLAEFAAALLVGNGQAMLMANANGTKGHRHGGRHGLDPFPPPGAKFRFQDVRLPGRSGTSSREWKLDKPGLSWCDGVPVVYLALDLPKDEGPKNIGSEQPDQGEATKPTSTAKRFGKSALRAIGSLGEVLMIVGVGVPGALLALGCIVFAVGDDGIRHTLLDNIARKSSALAERYDSSRGLREESLPTAHFALPTDDLPWNADASPRRPSEKAEIPHPDLKLNLKQKGSSSAERR